MTDSAHKLPRELGSAGTTTDSILAALRTVACDTAVGAFDDPTQLPSTILSVMKNHHMAESVQGEACRALGILANNHAVIQNSITQHADGIDTILKAMRNHETAQGVQQGACKLLRILAEGENDRNRVAIAQHGGIDSILAAMRLHRIAVRVQKQACGALLILAVNEGNRKLIVEKGGLDTLLTTLLDWSQVKAVQLDGCCTLSILATGNTDYQKSIVKMGGADAIKRAMVKHDECSMIRDVGRKALAVLKMSDAMHPALQLVPELGPHASADRAVLILRSFTNWPPNVSRFPTQFSVADGINSILAAMQNHGTVEDFQKYGCSALCMLVYHTDASRTGTISIAQKGAIIDASLTAMRNHLLGEGLQAAACLLLKNLARFKVVGSDTRKLIGQKGGIDSILRAMRNHGGLSVQWEACGALNYLAKNRDNSILIGQKDGIDAILAAMHKYPMEPHVQGDAYSALVKLADIDDNQKLIIEKRGIEAIVLATQNYPHLDRQRAIKRIRREE